MLTEFDKEALNGEDANILNIPKDWPKLSSGPSKFRLWMSASAKRQLLDSVATQQSISDDPVKSEALGLNSLYERLPPFDVQARWTLREERRVMRKINRQVLIFYILSSFFCGGNLTGLPVIIMSFMFIKISLSEQAQIANLIVFILSYSLTEILSRYLSHTFDPRRLVSTSLLAIGLGSIAQYWISNIPILVLAHIIFALRRYASYFSDCCMNPFYTFQGHE
ncbi:uncharacterized protein V1516DRAFT_683718 [Lipomyces oligophaga]|uniref:uncharacterized protein n=1 Tax=Lipomyces oligophaga TaxID=45792 RepID=UPI0034CF4CCB